jgi:hypothetical protein
MVNRDAEGERRDKRDLMPRLSISSRHMSRIAISAGGTKMGSGTVCRLPDTLASRGLFRRLLDLVNNGSAP